MTDFIVIDGGPTTYYCHYADVVCSSSTSASLLAYWPLFGSGSVPSLSGTLSLSQSFLQNANSTLSYFPDYYQDAGAYYFRGILQSPFQYLNYKWNGIPPPPFPDPSQPYAGVFSAWSGLTAAGASDCTISGSATGTSVTVEFWVNLNTLAAVQAILDKDADYRAEVSAAGAVTITHRAGTTLSTGAGVVTAGTWYHIVYTDTAGSQKIYVNAVQQATSSTAGNHTTSTGSLRVPSERANSMNGQICHLSIYNTALSLATIQLHYVAAFTDGHTLNGLTGVSLHPSAPNKLRVSFLFEPTAADATTVANYTFSSSLSSSAAVAVAGTSNRQYDLTILTGTTPFVFGNVYKLTITNIHDSATGALIISPGDSFTFVYGGVEEPPNGLAGAEGFFINQVNGQGSTDNTGIASEGQFIPIPAGHISLSFSTNVSGTTTVKIDGNSVGTTPVTASIVAIDHSVVFSSSLPPLTFTFATNVSGTTTVKVDGSSIGTTPVTASISPLNHAILYSSSLPPFVIPTSPAPVVSNVVPPTGSNIFTDTHITFDVTDDEDAFRAIILHAHFPSGLYEVVVYDNTFFSNEYSSSLVTPISGGYHFNIHRNDGWQESPTFVPYAIDVSGSENI